MRSVGLKITYMGVLGVWSEVVEYGVRKIVADEELYEMLEAIKVSLESLVYSVDFESAEKIRELIEYINECEKKLL